MLPDGYTAKVAGNVLIVYERKDHRIRSGHLRCRNCKYLGRGHATGYAFTDVCFKRVKGKLPNGELKYYAQTQYGYACSEFERRDAK